MLTANAVKTWSWIHKWSSLVCTAFMLLLCLTGLPLIFGHEIAHLTGTHVASAPMPAGTPRASLDAVIAAAQARQPDRVLQFLSEEADDDGFWYVTFGDSITDEDNRRTVAVDARSAEVIAEPRFDEGFMHVMYQLHVDLLAGLPGTLFLGFMGLLLVLAIVSGALLYGRFMRKLDFGAVRRDRTPRVKWLDLHNLLGIVTLVWAFVVGVTGVINTLGEPVIALWRADQLAAMVAPYQGQPVPQKLASLQASVSAAQAVQPGMKLRFVAWPGTYYSSPHHYGVFMRGTEPLTGRLFKPVLVDAQTAKVTASGDMPWYVSALLVSQPLHFGDYGGLPLKTLWALLDIATIVVLGSGLYLWARRRQPRTLADDAGVVLPAGAAR